MRSMSIARCSLASVLLILVTVPLTRAPGVERHPDPVAQVVETLRAKPSLEEWERVVAQLTPAMYDELYARARRLTSAGRRNLMDYLLATYPGHREQREAGIATRHIIRYFVRHLDDSEAGVRNGACYVLSSEDVPDVYLRDFTPEILESIRKYPETQKAARLLGKLGCASAKELLLTPEMVEIMGRQEPVPEGASERTKWRIQMRNRDRRSQAESPLAKLGDRELELKLIREFRNGGRDEKSMLSEYLGYVGSPGCVVELARAFLETPRTSTSEWKPLWMRIAEALHEALPQEPTFWFTYSHHGGKASYDKINAWIKEYLGMEQTDIEKTRSAIPVKSRPY